MRELAIALVQEPPVFLNLSASVAMAELLIRAAAAEDATIIVFPEAWLPGYPILLDEAPGAALWAHKPAAALFRRLFDNAPSLDGPEIAHLSNTAASLGVDVIIGIHERRGASLYNSAVRLGAAGSIEIHRKIMPTYGERLIWGAADGSTLDSWPTPSGPMGALICWEHWMPLARAALHHCGEVLHFALWPALGETQQIASRHYAFEGQCYVAAAGCVLTREDVLVGFDSVFEPDPVARELLEAIPESTVIFKAGGSAVIAPDASYVAGPAGDDRRTLHARIDLRRLAEGRMLLDTAGHYARPDIFELNVDRRTRDGVRFVEGMGDGG